ncbi:MAG: RNA polymerase sigma factor [Candidatus Methylomirabilales bacterium]
MSKDQAGRELAREDEDASLVSACRRGDDEAFGRLVERHQKRMINVAYRMTGNYEEACDIVQDAFLAAYRAIGKFRAEARFSTWLCGIVLNAAKTRLKRTKDQRERTVSLDDPAGPPERLAARAETREASALEVLERKEIQAAVQHCIGTLAGEYREVIVLRDTLGYSYEDIRAMLGVPEGTIKSRLYRARAAVKNCLKAVLGDL